MSIPGTSPEDKKALRFFGITELCKHAFNYAVRQFQKISSCQGTVNYAQTERVVVDEGQAAG